MGGKDGCPKKKKLPKSWRAKFISALTDCGVMSYAAKKAGVGTSTIDRHRKKDAGFEALVQKAIEEATDSLEIVARERATKGATKPVYQGGKLVGTVQEYSDTLLIFLLKGNRPDKFRDRHSVELGGVAGGPIAVEFERAIGDLYGPKTSD